MGGFAESRPYSRPAFAQFPFQLGRVDVFLHLKRNGQNDPRYAQDPTRVCDRARPFYRFPGLKGLSKEVSYVLDDAVGCRTRIRAELEQACPIRGVERVLHEELPEGGPHPRFALPLTVFSDRRRWPGLFPPASASVP